jgi:hypothetical protein
VRRCESAKVRKRRRRASVSRREEVSSRAVTRERRRRRCRANEFAATTAQSPPSRTPCRRFGAQDENAVPALDRAGTGVGDEAG